MALLAAVIALALGAVIAPLVASRASTPSPVQTLQADQQPQALKMDANK